MLKCKLQEKLQEEYSAGFSEGIDSLERDIIWAAKSGTPIELNGKQYLVAETGKACCDDKID